eukprot:m.95805 g.95805  ORF g.95805 m.95805 type:complete len:464 (+) comp10126_c1_seq2:49-1440(+)
MPCVYVIMVRVAPCGRGMVLYLPWHGIVTVPHSLSTGATTGLASTLQLILVLILRVRVQLAELRDHMEVADVDRNEAVTRADELADENADLREEMVALRKSHLKLRDELSVEKAKNDELGLELLKAANGGGQGRSNRTTTAQPYASDNDRGGVPTAHAALAARMTDDAALRNDVLRLERQLLSRDERAKRWEQSSEGGPSDTRLQQLEAKLRRVQDELNACCTSERAAVRDANAARAQARETSIQNDALLTENSDLKVKQADRIEQYRARLTKYVRDIGDFMSGSGGEYFPGMEAQLKRYVDLMLRDLTDSYAHREQQLCTSIERHIRRQDELAIERDRLARAYETCTAQLRAAGIAIKADDPLDGASSAVARSYPTDTHARIPSGGTSSANHAVGGAGSYRDVQHVVTEFTRTTQRNLEQERATLLIRCAAAEEKAKRMEAYISTKMTSYQEEIVRLRKLAR